MRALLPMFHVSNVCGRGNKEASGSESELVRVFTVTI